MSEQAFCIHGHFYQPPREDPQTGTIPVEAGAAPFSNWNERIMDDCYRPNAEAGNFGNISFNIGPTLSEWMEQNHPSVIQRTFTDDRYNIKMYSAGNAMAQSFHHTILPLATLQDKFTQVRWGITHFIHRYGRQPAGMWLPETAVDMETLEVLFLLGIRFTILAPWQAISEIDSRQPYLVDLGQNRSMAVFFYDRELSSGISFDQRITSNADDFVNRYLSPRYSSGGGNQLILVATDGELYGHHQEFRYEFLKRLYANSLNIAGIHPVYPEWWLNENPPKEFVEIQNNTSWSCMHDLLRWSGSCSCTPNPDWKAPLRQALNRVAGTIDQVFLDETRHLTKDPWTLRDLALQARDPHFDLLQTTGGLVKPVLNAEKTKKATLLLRSQFERQRMFASCAWFFEDFDRIEPQNAVRYAANAIHLAQKATGTDLAGDLKTIFEKVNSNRTGLNASKVFEEFLERVSL